MPAIEVPPNFITMRAMDYVRLSRKSPWGQCGRPDRNPVR
jgi:hypothetical protein